jgi:hypothetical protein
VEHAGIAIDIPAGAVESDTEFAIQLPPEGSGLEGRVVANFLPHGVSFKGPVTLKFDTNLLAAERTTFAVSRWGGDEWERQPTFLGNGGIVSAEVAHFSLYGLEGLCGPVVGEGEGCRELAPDGGGPGLYVNGWTVDQCHNMQFEPWFVDWTIFIIAKVESTSGVLTSWRMPLPPISGGPLPICQLTIMTAAQGRSSREALIGATQSLLQSWCQ